MSEVLQHDIVIVGGGGAGLRAAIAAAETDPTLDIAIVSKVYPMRSHTVSAEGGAAGVSNLVIPRRTTSATPSPAPIGSPIRTRSSCW